MSPAKEVDNTFSSDSLASISRRSLSFDFGERRIHAFERNGEVFFVANEVATALGYSNSRKAVQDHCKSAEICKSHETLLLGLPCESPRGLTIIPERDVYRLIMRSKLPAAEAFEEKVVGEVLPAIRKTGGYMAAAPKSRLTVLGTIVPQCLEASFNKSASGFSTVRQARLVSAPVVNLIRQFWLEANLKADGLTFHSL